MVRFICQRVHASSSVHEEQLFAVVEKGSHGSQTAPVVLTGFIREQRRLSMISTRVV
jgi:hypothetical protein